jgi:ATP-dependent RNA helicase RhlE
LTSFLDLGLSEPITRALAEEQYTAPTPIQSQTIPQVLAGRDVVGIAQTGTGKTAAFALPMLNHLLQRPSRPQPRTCRALVLSPTRELSAQIVESFLTYGRHTRPRVALAIGGVPIGRQIRALGSGADVLVATPGRLLDLVQSRALHLDKVEIFVLDEADRMLDMGFIHDIRKIVAKLPTARQTLFFSATMPREIEELANSMLRDPVRVAVTPQSTTVERIAQRVVFVDRNGKPALLADVLRNEPIDRALVFTRTKRGADRVVRDLGKRGVVAEAIHGNKSQNARERVLAAFRDARGIDVEGISHVVNYDLPNIPESYVHRIGRTARAGAEGVAISFCDGEERAYLRDIERLIRMSIPSSGQTSGQGARQEARHESRQRPHQNERRGQQPRAANHNGRQQQQNRDGGRHKAKHGKPAHRNGQRPPQREPENRGPRPIASTKPISDGTIGSVGFLQR